MKRIVASLILVGLLGMTVLSVAAADTTQVITEVDVTRQLEDTPPTDNWVLYTRAAAPGTGTFVEGPGTPPLSTGSLQLTTNTSAEKVYLFNYDHIGTALAGITAINYATYQISAPGQVVPALNIQVDFNGPDVDGGFTTLVFEPIYNTSQGPVVGGAWQDWDAIGGGIWWSTRAINGQCAGATVACWRAWDFIVANNPDAVILGGFGVNQGSGNPGVDAAVDALTLGVGSDSITYDFELLTAPPTDKDQCKDGGWQNFNNPTFENQGQCVSYANANN